MEKYRYLPELDSVRNTNLQVAIAQNELWRALVADGYIVVLTMQQLTDSKAFVSLLGDKKTYELLLNFFARGRLVTAQYYDWRQEEEGQDPKPILIRTPSQHAQRSLGKILEGKGGNVDFIFSLFGFHKDKEAERLYWKYEKNPERQEDLSPLQQASYLEYAKYMDYLKKVQSSLSNADPVSLQKDLRAEREEITKVLASEMNVFSEKKRPALYKRISSLMLASALEKVESATDDDFLQKASIFCKKIGLSGEKSIERDSSRLIETKKELYKNKLLVLRWVKLLCAASVSDSILPAKKTTRPLVSYLKLVAELKESDLENCVKRNPIFGELLKDLGTSERSFWQQFERRRDRMWKLYYQYSNQNLQGRLDEEGAEGNAAQDELFRRIQNLDGINLRSAWYKALEYDDESEWLKPIVDILHNFTIESAIMVCEPQSHKASNDDFCERFFLSLLQMWDEVSANVDDKGYYEETYDQIFGYLESFLGEHNPELQDSFAREKETSKTSKQKRRLALLQQMVQGFQGIMSSMRAGVATIRLFPQLPSAADLFPLPSRVKTVRKDEGVAESGWERDIANMRSDWDQTGETLRAAYRRLS